MSLYTTEVRYICETAAGYKESQGQKKVNEILSECWDKVIPQDWPIFDEDYRSVLCQKILKHYCTREIGLETVGLWQLKLETKLNEIMPYYNELYRTTLIEFDPLRDVDYYRAHEGSGEGETTEETSGSRSGRNSGNRQRAANGTKNSAANGTSNETTWDVYSDTPQGALTNVANETYLTNARKVTDAVNTTNQQADTVANTESENTTGSASETTSGDRSGQYSNTDQYLDHVYGKMNTRSYPKVIRELRENIINVDMMIIEALSDLFFLLWR